MPFSAGGGGVAGAVRELRFGPAGATAEPGFLVDGLDVTELGTRIILPPFLEDRREQIEARLTPLPDPRASWSLME